jgi:hypothetical protein
LTIIFPSTLLFCLGNEPDRKKDCRVQRPEKNACQAHKTHLHEANHYPCWFIAGLYPVYSL